MTLNFLKPNKEIHLFDLEFDSVTFAEAANLLINYCEIGLKAFVVTPNVDHIVQINSDQRMRGVFKRADFVFADGMPLVWFSWLLPSRYHLPERVNGTNLMEALLSLAGEHHLSVAFLGGELGAAEELAAKLRQISPDTTIAGFHCPPFGFELSRESDQAVVDIVNSWKTDFLFIGLGTPKQELWLSDHWDALNFKVAVGIGSAIDLLAGRKKRAPIWMQQAGLEWLWRVGLEPKRLWKRYFIDDLKFITIALPELVAKWKHTSN